MSKYNIGLTLFLIGLIVFVGTLVYLSWHILGIPGALIVISMCSIITGTIIATNETRNK